MPTTPVKVVGEATGRSSRARSIPSGLVLIVTSTVRGDRSRLASVTRPLGSTTRTWIRNQTLDDVSPEVGIATDPEVTPEVVERNGCVCSSWWNSIHHVKAPSGSGRPWPSTATASNRSSSPAAYLSSSLGERNAIVGAEKGMTVRVASSLVTWPKSLETTTWKRAPSSSGDRPDRESVGEVSPGRSTPSRRH